MWDDARDGWWELPSPAVGVSLEGTGLFAVSGLAAEAGMIVAQIILG